MPADPDMRLLAENSEPLWLTNLLTGVTIGVTTAVLLGLGEWLRRWLHRREQIKFVRELIVEKFTRLRDQEPLPPLPNGNDAPSVDVIRWEMYKGVLRDLEVALSYRLTMLNYEKIHEIQSILASQRDLIRNLFGERRYPNGPAYYQQRYDDFQRLVWLRLPPHLFPQPSVP